MATDNSNASSVEENELQAFVTSTLTAIMRGIADAQPAARVASAHGTGEYGFSAPDSVAFDIAVNARRTGSKRGGFRVEVFSLGANAGADSAVENSTVSRVQFTIPTKFKKQAA
jgi:hypothetical protein